MSFKIGDKAPDFSDLPGVDGKNYSLSSFDDKKAVVIVISCNHCPYVVAYEERMVQIQRDYADRGVQLVAINPNNEISHPGDSMEKMKIRAKERGFNFPYLRDKTQETAKAYGGQFTPEIYLLDQDRRLAYHGRIDDNYDNPSAVRSHDLRNALDAVLSGKTPTVQDTTAIGCTVKWL